MQFENSFFIVYEHNVATTSQYFVGNFMVFRMALRNLIHASRLATSRLQLWAVLEREICHLPQLSQ